VDALSDPIKIIVDKENDTEFETDKIKKNKNKEAEEPEEVNVKRDVESGRRHERVRTELVDNTKADSGPLLQLVDHSLYTREEPEEANAFKKYVE
jgi:hypothetical protein